MKLFTLDHRFIKVHRGRRRVTALDKEYAKALEGTLTEWLSKKNEKAYRKL